MKIAKLMMAAAVAVGLTGIAQADVTSSNVVGYNGSALGSSGFKGVGATFVNVTGKTNTLADVTVTGYSGAYEAGDIVATKLDSHGLSGVSYVWVDSTDGGTYYGWYSSDWETSYNDVTLAPGESLWIQSPSSNLQFQSAGMVSSTDIAVTLPATGFKLVSNPMPATLALGKITVSGYSGAYEAGDIVATKLDSHGLSGASYVWVDSTDGGTYYGWYSSDWETSYNDVTLAPGESLWIQAPSSDYVITFPTPLAE